MEKYWEIALPVMTAICGLALLGMRSYIREKFKNIATHEDIGNITRKVESVKKELSILTNKHNVIFNEEKEALLTYMSSWTVWYGSIQINIEDYNEHNYLSILKLEPIFKQDFDKVQITMPKIELFVDNDELVTLIHELNEETHKLHKINLQFATKIYAQYYYMKEERKKIGDEVANRGFMPKAIEQRYDALANIIFDYKIIIPPFYKNIENIKFDFINLSKAYIRRGVNQEYLN